MNLLDALPGAIVDYFKIRIFTVGSEQLLAINDVK